MPQMYMNNSMGDSIQALPTDQIQPSPQEMQVYNAVFQQNNLTTMQKVVHGLRDIILAGILFIVFQLPQIDELLEKFIPVARTSYPIRVVLKAVMFSLVYFMVKNWYLTRKG